MRSGRTLTPRMSDRDSHEETTALTLVWDFGLVPLQTPGRKWQATACEMRPQYRPAKPQRWQEAQDRFLPHSQSGRATSSGPPNPARDVRTGGPSGVWEWWRHGGSRTASAIPGATARYCLSWTDRASGDRRRASRARPRRCRRSGEPQFLRAWPTWHLTLGLGGRRRRRPAGSVPATRVMMSGFL